MNTITSFCLCWSTCWDLFIHSINPSIHPSIHPSSIHPSIPSIHPSIHFISNIDEITSLFSFVVSNVSWYNSFIDFQFTRWSIVAASNRSTSLRGWTSSSRFRAKRTKSASTICRSSEQKFWKQNRSVHRQIHLYRKAPRSWNLFKICNFSGVMMWNKFF